MTILAAEPHLLTFSGEN
jgi:hypothetical protein